MAKIEQGYMGGFSGRLGPAVGYMWNGKWCLRSRPAAVRNPRTAAQQEHRAMFRDEVRLAARMRWAVLTALTEPARAAGMTSYNLFVSLNQHAFSSMDGVLQVDYPSLVLSVGPVAPVRLGDATVDGEGSLTVPFERNPLHQQCDSFDAVHLYLYCPQLGQGFLAAPVYRREQKISLLLPEGFAEHEVHLYAFVVDRRGRCSTTAYGGLLQPQALGLEAGSAAPVDAPGEGASAPASGIPDGAYTEGENRLSNASARGIP